MVLLNCTRCGNLFAQERLSQKVCRHCFALDEQEFQLCRDYLRRHPKVTLHEVSENTGIPLKIMMSWVREGRLHV